MPDRSEPPFLIAGMSYLLSFVHFQPTPNGIPIKSPFKIMLTLEKRESHLASSFRKLRYLKLWLVVTLGLA